MSRANGRIRARVRAAKAASEKGIWDVGYGIWDVGCEIGDLGFGIGDWAVGGAGLFSELLGWLCVGLGGVLIGQYRI